MSYKRVALGAAVTKGAVPLIPKGPRSVTRDDALIAMSRMPVSGHWGGTGDEAREMRRALQDLPVGAPVPREWVLTIRRRFNPNILKANGLEGLGDVPPHHLRVGPLVHKRRHLRLVRALDGFDGLGSDADLAAEAHIPVAVLQAIRSVESGGNPSATRFEPHLFLRRVPGAPIPYTPGATGAASHVASETNRAAFERARAINEQAAIDSTSWGLYQVLGAHLRNVAPSNPVAAFDANPRAISDRLLVDWFATNPAAALAARVPNFSDLAYRYNGSRTSPWGARVAAAYARLGGANAGSALLQASVAAALPWVAGISVLTIGSLYGIWWWDKHAPKRRAA